MNAFAIQERTKEILSNVGTLQKHILAYEDFMKKIGNNLSTTVNAYNTAYKELSKIDKDVVKLVGGEKVISVETVEKPLIDE
jgi:DNA recombination protein RmuC